MYYRKYNIETIPLMKTFFFLNLTLILLLPLNPLFSLSFTNSLKSLTSSTTNKLSSLKTPITGWAEIEFGMKISEVKSSLNNSHPNLIIRENPFSDIIGEEDNNFLEINSDSQINSLQFQFNKIEELYLIRIRLSPRYFSFTNLLSDLKEKYGDNFILKYEKAIWEDENNRLELYKNNQVIYLDKNLIDGNVGTSLLEQEKANDLQRIREEL